MLKTCPCCGQSFPDDRPLGLKLMRSRLKLLEIVRKAGKHGIPTESLFERLYKDDPNGGPLTGMRCMYVRVNQLNKKLRVVGKKIVADSTGGAAGGRYFFRDIQ